MKKHTVETLKYYLGKEVWVKDDVVRVLEQINSRNPGCIFFKIKSEMGDDTLASRFASQIYPILKEQNDLPESEILKIMEVNQRAWPRESPKATKMLIDLGAGAREDDKSPTGYVDLFGMPCVTPKQVEEGFEL